MYEPYQQVIVSIILSLVLLTTLFLYQKIFKRDIPIVLLLVLISLLPLVSIFRAGTYEAGDLTLHSVFLQSFYESLQEELFIPQWAGGLCAGYGCPVFLFEYVTPFYIGALFHFLGFTYIESMKLFLAAMYILSGITMYLFVKDSYGKNAALVGALLYLFAPIHLQEMHFRVSVGTHAAFVFIPLAFLFAKKSLNGSPMFIVFGAINFLLLILSHSSIAFVIVPASLMYAFLHRKKISQLQYPLYSLTLGAGLSAYYVIPALFELKYTWYSQTIRYVDDFKPLAQYLYSPKVFGLLFQGSQGELRLIVGYPHLFIVFSALIILFQFASKKLYKKTADASARTDIIFSLSFFFICFLLMLSFTKPLWDTIFFLRSFVLPWRMLVPIAFATAFLGAIVTRNWRKHMIMIFCSIMVFSTILNWANRKMVPLDPDAYRNHWSLYTEYFEPNNDRYRFRYENRVEHVIELIKERPKESLEILSGKGEIKAIERTQNTHTYILYAQTTMRLAENTFYFPGWKVFIDDKEISIDKKNEQRFGVLTFSLPPGLYLVHATFEDTYPRSIGKTISFLSFFAAGTLLFFSRKKHQIESK